MGNSRNEPPPNRRGRRPQRKTQMSPLLSSICFVPGDGRTKISTEESPFFRALPEKKPKEEEGILYSSRGTERDRHATDGRAGKIVELREQKLREIERAFLGPRGGLLRSPDTEDELRKIQHQNNPCCRQKLSHYIEAFFACMKFTATLTLSKSGKGDNDYHSSIQLAFFACIKFSATLTLLKSGKGDNDYHSSIHLPNANRCHKRTNMLSNISGAIS